MGLVLPSGDIIYEVEIQVTFFQSGANYYARYGAINVLRGNASGLTIVPGVGAVSDSISSSSFIFNANIHTMITTILQGAVQRIAPLMLAGARFNVNPQTAGLQANSQTEIQTGINGIAPGTPITNIINWNGLGALNVNLSILNLTFKGN